MTSEQIKDALKGILSYVNPQGRFVYIDYPLHMNIGDLLINLGTEAFFAEHRLAIEQRYSIHNLPSSIPRMDESVTLLLHGGGNLGDLWPRHQIFRERILRKYPRNRIVLLPQTLHFSNAEKEKAACFLLASHTNLHLFLRDGASLERARLLGVANSSLMPDLAHQLTGLWADATSTQPDSPLFLFRGDHEGGPVPHQIATYSDRAVDWASCIPPRDRLRYLLLRAFLQTNLPFTPEQALCRAWYRVRDRIIQDGIGLLSGASVVVTDRLHAMLLGLLLGKRVVAFDNSYGKLSSYYETWLSDVPGITFIGSQDNRPLDLCALGPLSES